MKIQGPNTFPFGVPKGTFFVSVQHWLTLAFCRLPLKYDLYHSRIVRVLARTCSLTQKCEFHKIKVAKARKNSSVRLHFPRLYV